MSARRGLQQHLYGLTEINQILNSMKTLAVIETRKLARFGATQHKVVTEIERAAADFCRSFPHISAYPPCVRFACYWVQSGVCVATLTKPC